MSIFISIANYREPEIRNTILSAIDNADNPEDLFFGVYSQVEEGEHIDLSDIPNLTETVIPASQATGPSKARKEIMDMFNDQNYFFQIDAHQYFVESWDTKLINEYIKIQNSTNNNKIIISQLPDSYTRNGDIVTLSSGFKYLLSEQYVPSYCMIDGNLLNPVAIPILNNESFHETSTIFAGFIFTNKNFVNDVVYSNEWNYYYEDRILSIISYQAGWISYAISENILYHMYERPEFPRVWKDYKDNWNNEQLRNEEPSLSIIFDNSIFEEYTSRYLVNK